MSLRPLRPRQAQAIASIREAVKQGHKHIILQAPTGFGKTLLSAHLIQGALDKARKPLFIAPAINLITQTVASLASEGIALVGVIQANHRQTNRFAPVQVASVQTLVKRDLPDSHFVIVDEAHQRFSAMEKLLDTEWKDTIVIGLSATPWAKGMGLRWTKLIVAATTQQLIDEGHLCPFKVFAPAVEADLSHVKTVAGEYHEGQASAIMREAKITADVVKTYKEKGTNGKTFLFAVDCAHAQHLQLLLVEAGIPCGYMDGETSAEDRAETFRSYRCGEIEVIASVGTLVTGIDEDVRCIIDCAPTKSRIRFVQKFGRGLRTAEGKDFLIYLDHAGNTQRLGLPTNIYQEELDTRTAGDGKPDPDAEKEPNLPKKCPGCSMLNTGFPCSNCGFKPDPKDRVSMVEHVDGELVEYGSTPSKDKPKAKKDDPAYKARFYAELLGYAGEVGKSQSWVLAQFKNRFDHWPAKKNLVEPLMAGVEVRNYIKASQIRWAKGKEKKPVELPPKPPNKSVGFEFGHNA